MPRGVSSGAFSFFVLLHYRFTSLRFPDDPYRIHGNLASVIAKVTVLPSQVSAIFSISNHLFTSYGRTIRNIHNLGVMPSRAACKVHIIDAFLFQSFKSSPSGEDVLLNLLSRGIRWTTKNIYSNKYVFHISHCYRKHLSLLQPEAIRLLEGLNPTSHPLPTTSSYRARCTAPEL